tara:strand:- start:1266 stop:1904 length:639 start_codon:yes stop_codon:yes gene_type:complete
MTRTKYCEYVYPEGHEHEGQKCNAAFSVKIGTGTVTMVHCPTHNDESKMRGGLLRTTNKHAQAANAELMHEWVKERMKNQDNEDTQMYELKQKVAKLEDAIKKHDESSKIEVILEQRMHLMLGSMGLLNESGKLNFAKEKTVQVLHSRNRDYEERISVIEKMLGITDERMDKVKIAEAFKIEDEESFIEGIRTGYQLADMKMADIPKTKEDE